MANKGFHRKTDRKNCGRISAARISLLRADDPEISTLKFDRLMADLQKLESDIGTRTPDSPTQRVGGAPRKAI